MSGGWSRYTRGAASGRGTGCGASFVAAIVIGLALAFASQWLRDDGSVDQNMHGISLSNPATDGQR